MAKPIRVLIVEDSEDDSLLILRELQKGGYLPVHERVETAESLQKSLEGHSWDLVLSDFRLPHFSGPAALALIKEMGFDLPFILISGAIGEINAVSVMKAGAHDFVVKGNWARLIPAVERELREAEIRRMRRQGEERLKLQAFIMESMAEGLVVYDERGTILMTNRAFDLMFNYESGELFGRHVSLLNNLSADENTRLFDEVERRIKNNGTWIGELINSRKDGSQFYTSAHVSALESGNKRYIISVQEDITESKRVQGQVKQQLERLSALHEIDTAISSLTDLDMTLKIILNHAIKRLPADAAAVYLLDPYTQTLELKDGLYSKSLTFPKSLRIGENVAGLAALERRMISLEDVENAASPGQSSGETQPGDSPEAPNRAESNYFDLFNARFALPLIARGQTLGAFEVSLFNKDEFDQEWFNFFETLTGQLAIAFDNYSLFEGLQQSNARLILAFDETIESWASLVDQHCHRPEGYSWLLADAAIRLGRSFNLNESEIINIQHGALLYDIGLFLVPEHILQKSTDLSPDERAAIKRHPLAAYELIYPNAFLRPAIDIPYCHHERWDGSGYPRGLKGEEIPLSARIFAVIEVWNALLSDRPNRPAWTETQARKYMEDQSGHQFDPNIVETFLRSVTWATTPSR